MTDMNVSANPGVPDSVAPAPAEDSAVQKIFLGPNGIRAGWRLAIFLVIMALLVAGLNFSLRRIPAYVEWAKPLQGQISAVLEMVNEGLVVLALCLAVWVMSKIEGRTFADYGLPGREAFGKRFWQGAPLGFLSLSALLGAIGLLGGFSITGLETHGAEAAKFGALFGIGFILVGIFEEFSFRGYMQATLGSGIGFWPAAVILSICFGAIHLGNHGEAKIGAFMAGCFGIVAAFSLQRTGNLWFPIGMHAAWDWGETYFYGVADSGLTAHGRLLVPTSNGAADWITGGSVGPEGSYLVFLILVLMVVVIHFAFPAKKQQMTA